MSLLLDQLLTITSEDVIRNTIFEGAGVDPSAWVKTSLRSSAIRGAARGLFLAQTTNINLTKGVLLGLSRGVWLDLLGACFYNDPRLEALPTIRNATLSLPVGASPVTVPLGTRVQEKVSGREWYVSDASPGAIGAGTSQARVLTCATAGEIGNVAVNTAFVSQVPALVVAFVNEPAVQTGVNRESDDKYTYRLSLRWSLNTYAVGPRAYERAALDAAPSISRARVRINYPTFNQIRVALRRPNGPALAEDVTLANARFALIAAANDIPMAEIAPTYPQVILAQPRIQRGTTTQAQALAALVAGINAMPIGGHHVQGSDAGRLLRDYLAQLLSCKLPGVTSAGIVTPAADVVLGPNEIVSTNMISVEPEFYDWVE